MSSFRQASFGLAAPRALVALDVQAGRTACLAFADGFESGNTGAWAAVAPP